jgi:hypothetical protein
MKTLTRQEAIDTLVGNEIFYEETISEHNKASEFYIKHLMEGWDICDIDRMAHLNTLFGYDIGINNWSKIDSELWCNKKYWDDTGCGVEIMELGYTDKEFVQKVCNELGLDLSFDKWRTEDFKCYEYY